MMGKGRKRTFDRDLDAVEALVPERSKLSLGHITGSRAATVRKRTPKKLLGKPIKNIHNQWEFPRKSKQKPG
jgi:hypothetical protein